MALCSFVSRCFTSEITVPCSDLNVSVLAKSGGSLRELVLFLSVLKHSVNSIGRVHGDGTVAIAQLRSIVGREASVEACRQRLWISCYCWS